MIKRTIKEYKHHERLKNKQMADRFNISVDSVVKNQAKGTTVYCFKDVHILNVKENYVYEVKNETA